MKSLMHPVMIVLLVMWLVTVVDFVIPAELTSLGIRPRRLRGLIGIPLAPFLHAGFGHLIANTVPLIVLLSLAVGTRHRAWVAVAAITIGGGALLWIFGRNAIHVGASGLVFGLMAYLIVIGVLEKEFVSLGVAAIVGVLFGGTLISGVLPSFGTSVSWEGHLFGAIAGVAIAFLGSRV